MRAALVAVLLALGAALAAPARAGDPFDTLSITKGELARLPVYCPHAWGYVHRGWGNWEERERWDQRLGPTMRHMHHYCWSILKYNRAHGIGVSAQLKNALIESAIVEAHYLIDRAPADYIFLPEAVHRVGIYNFELGRWLVALDYFERARTIKPDYYPPYLEMANVNMSVGRKEDAIAALQAGLKVMPDEERLKEALKRIEATPVQAVRREAKGVKQP